MSRLVRIAAYGILVSLVISAFCLSASSPDKIDGQERIVAAHYAPWYMGSGPGGNWYYEFKGKIIRTAYTPRLGYYDNRDPKTLAAQIPWAKKYGLNTFMIEWCGIADQNYPGSHETNVRIISQNPAFQNIRFYFVYSIIMALRRVGDEIFDPVDFDKKENVNKLLSDFRYAAKTYFVLPNHLRIKGRPVVYLWAVGLATGNFKKALSLLRKAIKAQIGVEPYLIGDEVSWNSVPDADRTPLFDAVMPYMSVRVEGTPPKNYALADVIPDLIRQFRYWRNICDDLGLDFIPGVHAGLNAVGAHWCYDSNGNLTLPTVSRSPESFREFVVQAKAFIDPDPNMFYITSWSEWNEGTNIEPAKEFGFDYLKALKKGLEGTSPLAIPQNTILFRFLKVWDPPSVDDRLLAVCYDYLEFLDAAGNVLQKIDFGEPEARIYLGWGWSGDEETGTEPENFDFVWAGTKLKYATLHLDVPPAATFLRLRIYQIPSQETTVYLDGALLARLPEVDPNIWKTHLISLPSH
jgi:hypothetical protein